MKKTDEELINELKDFILKNDYIPKSVDLQDIDELASKNTYGRRFGSYNKVLKLLGFKPRKEYKNPLITKECENCGIEYESKNVNSKFCSLSCANSHNNQNRNKKQQKFCVECEKPHDRHSSFCSNVCWMISNMKHTTIEEISIYKEQNRYRAVRDRAFNFYKHYGKKEVCENCGYDKHVEHCHIKAIKDFSIKDSVWECNKPDNIVFLCRNCHWELDNGFITIESIKISTYPDRPTNQHNKEEK